METQAQPGVNYEEDFFKFKNPLVTELDYWMAIEQIGGMAWSVNHDLAHGRISDEKGDVGRQLLQVQAQQKRLVDALWEKFGVVAPKDCPQLTLEERLAGKKMPEPLAGMRWYWEWYETMKDVAQRVQYGTEVCSDCPYSSGPAGNTYVNCSLYPGCASCLHPDPATCLIIKRPGENVFMNGDYTEEEFFKKMLSEHGEEAVTRFVIKRESIRRLLDLGKEQR